MTLQKPEPRKRVKARKKRTAAKVVKSVRALCVERDGRCRLGNPLNDDEEVFTAGEKFMVGDYSDCAGPSEWAHVLGKKRSRTRGQSPEHRHDTQHSLMLCRKHHRREESGKLVIVALSDRGADGPLQFQRLKENR